MKLWFGLALMVIGGFLINASRVLGAFPFVGGGLCIIGTLLVVWHFYTKSQSKKSKGGSDEPKGT